MTTIRRHSSHPEIWVGEKKRTALLAVSIVCLLTSIGLVIHARNIVTSGNDYIDSFDEKLSNLKDKTAEAQHICDLAILTCHKN